MNAVRGVGDFFCPQVKEQDRDRVLELRKTRIACALPLSKPFRGNGSWRRFACCREARQEKRARAPFCATWAWLQRRWMTDARSRRTGSKVDLHATHASAFIAQGPGSPRRRRPPKRRGTPGARLPARDDSRASRRGDAVAQVVSCSAHPVLRDQHERT